MKIAGRLLLKNILLVSVLSSSDLIYRNTMFDAEAFTTRRALNEAVKRERNSWQEKLNKSQDEIRKLQSSLNNAQNENKKLKDEKATSEKTAKNEKNSLQNKLNTSQEEIKKLQSNLNNAQNKNKKLQDEKATSEKTAKNEKNSLQNKLNTSQEEIKKLQSNLNNAQDKNKKLQDEKATSEKTAKDKLMQVINEKENTVKELKTTRDNFKNTSDKLNKTITRLNKEKTKLKKNIQQVNKNLEATKKEYEAKLKAEQKAAQDKLTEETNRLNNKISEKTAQLNKALDTLKQVTQEYSETRGASSVAEVKNLVEIEILKSQVITKKTELKTLLQIAKRQDETKTAIIRDLRQKLNTLNAEFNSVLENTKATELKNLLYIEKLSEKINLLNNRNEALMKLGKERESKLIAKIKTLVKKQKAIRQEYAAIMMAYQIEEQKNLSLIDTLKFELNKAIKNNEMLISIAKRMKTEKEKEDFADSQSEAKQLLQIDVLNDELRDAIQKNTALLQNTQNIKNKTDNLIKNLANKSDASIRDLQAKLESSNKEFAKLKNRYNNREVWIKEIGALKGKAFESIFKGMIFDNSKNPFNQKISSENWLPNKKPEQVPNNLNGNEQISDGNALPNKYQNIQNASQWYAIPGGEQSYDNAQLVDGGNTTLNSNIGQVTTSQAFNYDTPSSNTWQQYNNTNSIYTIQPSIIPAPNSIPEQRQINGKTLPRNNQQYPNVEITRNIDQKPIGNKTYSSNIPNQTVKNIPENVKAGENEDVLKILDNSMKQKTGEDQTVDIAIGATIDAIKKMTDNDERKTNASVSLIGAGYELPEKLDAVVNVIKEKFKPEVLDKALKELSNRQTQKQNFVDESLRHMYGKDGDRIIAW